MVRGFYPRRRRFKAVVTAVAFVRYMPGDGVDQLGAGQLPLEVLGFRLGRDAAFEVLDLRLGGGDVDLRRPDRVLGEHDHLVAGHLEETAVDREHLALPALVHDRERSDRRARSAAARGRA